MPQKHVLVTGAGGFLGRHSVGPLLERGFCVHAAVSPRARAAAPVELDGAELQRVDLLDPAAGAALIRAVRPTHWLHFAWIAKPGVYWHSDENYRWLDAGRAMLAQFAAHGGERAVIAGSCAEYATTGSGLCVERQTALADAAGAAVTPYAECKLALQRELEAVGRRAGFSSAWGRIFLQFGPAEHPDRLVPSVIRRLLANQEAPCSHGRQVRSFLHAADVGGAFAALLASEVQGPINVGSDRSITLAGLVDMIAAQIGRPDLLRLGAKPSPAAEPAILVPDTRRLRDELGWTPKFELAAGLAGTIAWWRKELAC